MIRRLPEQAGEWIDRTRPIPFRFENRDWQGYAGDVITSALYANDIRFVGRSFKYHRPRGSYSLADHDANVLFTDGSHTNIRGDVTAVEPGMDLYAVNTFGGLANDRMRFVEKLAHCMPVGFYYKAFHRPSLLFPFHEIMIRKVAGLGTANPSLPPPSSPKQYAWCDLLVVGSGLSGMGAALAGADAGADVLLVEEQPQLGGSSLWQLGRDESIQEMVHSLVQRVEQHPRIRVRPQTLASGFYSDHWVALVDEEKLTKLRARTVVFANGAIEQPVVFQNNDLPGVMLASAAQRLLRLYAVKPFDRVIVTTANTDGYRAAIDFKKAGVEVPVVVDLRPGGESSELRQEAEESGINIQSGAVVWEALPTRGKTGIRGALVCPLDSNGHPHTGHGTVVPCDGIALSAGWMPSTPLPAQAGISFAYSGELEQWIPDKIPGRLFLAGRVNGIYDFEARHLDGKRAGLAAAKALGMYHKSLPTCPSPSKNPHSHPYPIYAHPGKKNFVDFDEDIHLADLVNAHQEGYDSSELLKRYSTLGMGPSQGKLSSMNAVRILSSLNGTPIELTGTTTSRPFYTPVPIGHLAGRRFHPIRHTPMHDWHEQNRAEMTHAGSWYRPEYYHRKDESRKKRILSEATAVRTSSGIIDLSTLGKIFINGPDAAEFLEHIYTGRFKKLPVGKQRYVIALDESGMVVEDGIVARLTEDVYYVTATSSGAEHFYRELQRWQIIWEMEVTLVNATAQYAAMNIAGPLSRDLLAPLSTVDLSPEAFPYLGVRQGEVAGVRAILLRVGFVGELGYEVHVPASQGLHVWETILAGGRDVGPEPFGVEAQRLLRMEKGHLIIGHDTDALTHPQEAGVMWTLGKGKSFYTGGKSAEIIGRKPLTRRLVGLRWPTGYPGPLPEECNLVLDAKGENILGRVTSVAHHSTLGHPIGMGLLHPEITQPGTIIHIRLDNGAISRAEVASLPHYDPENERQLG